MATGGRQPKKYKGKEIIDAVHPMTISVNEKDIRTSHRMNPGQCAIAKSVIRDKHVRSAHIGTYYALIEFASHYERYKINSAARIIVSDYDNTGAFQEGRYELLPPAKRERLTGVAHPRKSYSGPSGKTLLRRTPTRNFYKAKEAWQ